MTNHTTQATIEMTTIDVTGNVRELDEGHVDALCGSIKARGLIGPLVVKPHGDRYQLVAGFHRHAACRKAGLKSVPVVIRDHADEAVDRAVENITRRDLTALDEARAVQAMLDQGHNTKTAAIALGWKPARVTARAAILSLPEPAQQLCDRSLPAAAIKTLRDINTVSTAFCKQLATVLITHIDETGDEAILGQLATKPEQVIATVLGQEPPAARGSWYAAPLMNVSGWKFEDLNLGKVATEQFEELAKLSKDSYSYPTIRMATPEVDRARAAGVLIEFEHARFICDRALHRDLIRTALAHTLEATKAQAAQRRVEQRLLKDEQHGTPDSPQRILEREHRGKLRDFQQRAANVNLDLGASLIANLIEVEPDDIDLARFFVYGLLGPEGNYDARKIAIAGLRLVLEDLRETEQRARKDGTPRAPKVTYATGDDCEALLWRFLGRARTPRELYGRAVVIFAAGHFALQDALPGSQRSIGIGLHSSEGRAVKALEKLCTKHLPGTYRSLRKEIAAEAAEHRKQTMEVGK